MSPELTTILMLASLLVLLAGFPIAFGVGTVGLVFGLITSGPAFLYMMPMRVMSGTLSEYILDRPWALLTTPVLFWWMSSIWAK